MIIVPGDNLAHKISCSVIDIVNEGRFVVKFEGVEIMGWEYGDIPRVRACSYPGKRGLMAMISSAVFIGLVSIFEV